MASDCVFLVTADSPSASSPLELANVHPWDDFGKDEEEIEVEDQQCSCMVFVPTPCLLHFPRLPFSQVLRFARCFDLLRSQHYPGPRTMVFLVHVLKVFVHTARRTVYVSLSPKVPAHVYSQFLVAPVSAVADPLPLGCPASAVAHPFLDHEVGADAQWRVLGELHLRVLSFWFVDPDHLAFTVEVSRDVIKSLRIGAINISRPSRPSRSKVLVQVVPDIGNPGSE